MARKRRVFFPHLQSILKLGGLRNLKRGWLKALRGRAIALFLAAFFLSVNLPAVWAQSTGVVPEVQLQVDPTELVNQAQADYASGNYQQSANYLRQAITAFDDPVDELKRAIALSNLSLTYQALRDWDSAQRSIEDSLLILGFNPETLEREPSLEEQRLRILAPALDTYGQLWQKIGNPTQAMAIWQQATAIYEQLDQEQGWLNGQINQLQALQSMGLYQQAAKLAENLTGTFQALPTSPMKAKGLRSFGEALRNIGALKDSQEMLQDALTVAQQLEAPNLEKRQQLSTLNLSLGNTHKALGDREKERQISINRQGILPWQCLPLPADKQLPKDSVAAYEAAEKYYLEAEYSINESANPGGREMAVNSMTVLSAQLNRLAILLERNDASADTQELWHTIHTQLGELSPSRSTIYAQINLAKQGGCLKQLTNNETITWDNITNLLKTAAQNAQLLGDVPAESYALGNLGGLYEFFSWLESENIETLPNTKSNSGNIWQTAAETLTDQALVLAQPSKYPDIAYQWQWQLGRIKRAQGLTEEAVTLYKQSVDTLESVRGNLLTIASDVQFSFRDNVEPVYRELVDLLLIKSPDPSQDDLKEVVDLIDNLQLAELENFLRCRLPEAKLTEKAVDPHAAIFYPIILRDRLEVILSLPGEQPGEQQLSRKPISAEFNKSANKGFQTEFEKTVEDLQRALRRVSRKKKAQALSTDIYKQLIESFETELEADLPLANSNIHTLVFASDGVLRNLPMPVLYDAKRSRYLLERYAVAIAPSIKLLEPEPLPRNVKVLTAGSNQEQDHPFETFPFSELPYVENELKAIQSLFPSEELFNDSFNKDNLETELDSSDFSIVHLATHGEFSSDPEKTFIITSQDPLYAKDIDLLLRNRGGTNGEVKLLVLSACKTATGDNRAVLGLAGITVRAGSSSTLATLWSVDDQSAAQLMEQFYTELRDNPDITKAEALRRAQIQLLQDGNWNAPYHWAPYILVGNWL